MKLRFKYIISSLILLSLIGLGENIFISCPDVKYYKETEWVSTAFGGQEMRKFAYIVDEAFIFFLTAALSGVVHNLVIY